MSNINLKKFRNIGIAAHIDAGKTTFTERILFYTGITHKIGEVHEGGATMDWMEQERERGITITSAATACTWKNYYINIIDTPGHVDFTIEVGRSLRVLDGMIGVFCGVAGVQPQSETVWRQADRYNVPRIIFINKLDRPGADYFKAINDINKRLNVNAVAMQVPVGQSENFSAIIDIIERKMATFDQTDKGLTITWHEVPEEYKQDTEKYRNLLVAKASEMDDTLAEKFINEEHISIEEIKAALRKGTIERRLALAFGGSAFKNKGVQLALDAVIDYLPCPLDIEAVQGINPYNDNQEQRAADPAAPFCALAFKIMTDPFVGTLTFARVYSGTANAGSYVLNVNTGKKERISRIVKMHANKKEEISSVSAGDIAALVGLKDTTTGNTLAIESHPILLESIDIPPSVISTAIEPKNKGDYEKMVLALRKLMSEDPSFKFSYNDETSQTVITGMGELHLEIAVDRLNREHKVEVVVGKMQVAYRETIQKTINTEGKYIKQSGGRGQYGHVFLTMQPLERGKGYEFENKIVGGSIPKEFIPGVEKGLLEAINTGVLGGYPTVDMKIILTDGSYHDVDSSEMAFKIAASMAFKNGMRIGSPVILEPIMKVEVETPEEYMGDVMGDLNSRRGRILGMDGIGTSQRIAAEVPLKEIIGYATSLRSMTKGRATPSMEFSRYREVPKSEQEKIVEKKTTGNQ